MNRTIAALLGLGFLAASLAPFAHASSSPARTAVQERTSALDRLAGCVRERRALSVLIVIDKSGSLKGTDKENQRVRAAQVAVHGLAQLVDARPAVEVQVALAGFARDFTVSPWRSLRTSAAEIKNEIAIYESLNTGDATDYVLALNRAREVLSESAAGANPPCQALVWFTDGEYDPGEHAPITKQQGEHQLCDTGGVVDQLRGTNAAILTVALTTDLQASEQDLLRRITGVAPGCGGKESAGGGHYLAAAQASDLIDEFVRLLQPHEPEPLCEKAEADCTFTLPRLLKSFFVLIHTGSPTSEVSLRPPGNAQEIQLARPGADAPVAVAGSNLKWAWFGETVAVTGQLQGDTADRWSGQWRVLEAGGNRPHGRIYLYGNLEQQLVGETRFVRGEPWRFRAEIAVDGKSARGVDLSAVAPKFTASVTQGTDERPAQVRPVDGDPNAVDVSFTAPGDWHASAVTVKVDLGLRTSTGIDLSPVPLTKQVPVETRMRFTPAQLTPPPINGRETTTAVLTVTAPEAGGCVAIDASAVHFEAVPVDIETTTRSGQDCVPIAPSASVEIPVVFKAERGWTGTARSVVPMTLKAGDGKTERVDLPVSFGMVAVPNDPVRWLIVAILLAITSLPLLVTLLVNYFWLTRFPSPRALRIGRLGVWVTVDENLSRVYVEPVGAALDWPDHDIVHPVEPPPKRRLSNGFVTFRARSSWSPFAVPRTQILAAQGRVLATATHGPAAEIDGLPLHLPGLVVVTADTDRNPRKFEAEAVFVLGDERMQTDEIRSAVVAAAERLVPALPES